MVKKGLHVSVLSIYALIIMSMAFLTQDPIILLGLLVTEILLLVSLKKINVVKRTFKIFWPLLILTILINLIFSSAGVYVLFSVFNKVITLENIIYSSLFGVKLLVVIYIFYIIEILIDSDSAVSYFSAKMPKTTLLFMVCFKLIPNMRKKLRDLKDIYTVRGVDFESKSRFDRIKAQIPLLMVVIEEALESSFDIAESAYTKGFLTAKRTVFMNRKLNFIDLIISSGCSITFVIFIVLKSLGKLDYDVYENYIYSFRVSSIVIMLSIAFITVLIYLNYKESSYAYWYKGYELLLS